MPVLLACAVAPLVGFCEPAQAMRRACQLDATTKDPRCARAARKPAATGANADRPGKAPKIESSGVSPAADNIMPLLRPGTFRLDVASFFSEHPIFGVGSPRAAHSDIFETVALGYGVNPRLTVFAGALEVNSDRGGGPYQANYVDPKVGLVYRLAAGPELRGATLDFAGEVTINEPLSGPSLSGALPLSSLGPVGLARFLLTREVAPGFMLEGIGGFQAAQVATDLPFEGTLDHTTTDVDLLLGLAGQYRLSFISPRLYVNGELDYMKPLTDDTGQVIIDTPFRTTESYAATLGASYVLKPGSVVARLTDTIALDLANPDEPYPIHQTGRELYNTVGITLSFCNIEPGRWLKHGAP